MASGPDAEQQSAIPNTPGRDHPIWNGGSKTPPQMTPPPGPVPETTPWPTFAESSEAWNSRADKAERAVPSGSVEAFPVYGGASCDCEAKPAQTVWKDYASTAGMVAEYTCNKKARGCMGKAERKRGGFPRLRGRLR